MNTNRIHDEYRSIHHKGNRMSKVILITSFKGGVGKSTISNNMGDKLPNSIVLNLDMYQDAEDVNTCETVNISTEDNLTPFIDKYSDKEYIIIDAGGFDDRRLYEIDIDLFIFPLGSGYRSVKSTVDSVKTIYEKYQGKEPKTIFVVNEYHDDKEYETTVELMSEILQGSDIPLGEVVEVLGIKFSKAIATSENKKESLSYLRSFNKFFGHAYKNVDKNFEDLSNQIKSILK